MTSTQAPPATPVSPTVSRRARLGMAGGALLALSPAVWATDLSAPDYGTASFVAVAVSYWLALVVGPALVATGHTALRTSLGASAGRIGAAGAVLGIAGFTAVAVGNGIEVASVSAGGETVLFGYVTSYVGMLVGFLGSLLVGIAVLRRCRGAASRSAGWLLVLAVPLAVGLGALFATLLPDQDAGFAVATSVPTGIAWVLLGSALARGERTALA